MKTKSITTGLLQPLAKLLLLAILTIASPSLFAQGQVLFANNAPFVTSPVTAANGHADRLVYDTDNTTLLVGTNWLAQLYYAVGSGQPEASLTVVDSTPKRFRASGTTIPGTWQIQTKTLAGAPGNTVVTLQVRVWDGSLYADYDTAVANSGVTGKSVTFDYLAPAPPAAPSALNMEGLESFTLQ